MEHEIAPSVSVILPVRNGEDALSQCLDSLMALNYPKDRLEIIVVDNNSKDGTRDIAKRYPVKYVFETKIGVSAARNRGIKESMGTFVASLDVDCIADRNWITNLVKGFEDKETAGCGGRVLLYKPETPVQKYLCLKELNSQLGCIKIEELKTKTACDDLFMPFIMGCNSCYRRSVLEEVGFYDDEFVRTEDVEISIKIALHNYKLKYMDDALVYRHYRERVLTLFKKHFYNGYFRILALKKYRNAIGPLTNSIFIYGATVYLWGAYNTFIRSLAYLFRPAKRMEILFSLYDSLFVLAFMNGVFAGSLRFIAKKALPVNPSGNPISFFCNDDFVFIIYRKERVFNRYILRDAGARIWSLLMQKSEPEYIINTILSEYDITETEASRDVEDIINLLKKEKLFDGISKSKE